MAEAVAQNFRQLFSISYDGEQTTKKEPLVISNDIINMIDVFSRSIFVVST